jgi:site-specific DNA-methyltransferase (adenine-specific)
MTVTLLQGDCREVLAGLPAGSVDCIVTDPPYGDTSLAWDRVVTGWERECLRVLKTHGSLWCFGSLRFFLEGRADFAGWRLAQEIVWEKHNGSGFDTDRFKRVHELAVQYVPHGRAWREIYRQPQFVAGEARPSASIGSRGRTPGSRGRTPHRANIGQSGYEYTDRRMMRSVIYARSCHGRAEHPTQKPVEILEPLIRYSCPPGGTVLDPFAGSGSTGIAAKLAGCSAILVEIDPQYAAIARRRLQADAPLLTEVA